MPESILSKPVKNERPTPAFFSMATVFGSLLLTAVIAGIIFILNFFGHLLGQLNQI